VPLSKSEATGAKNVRSKKGRIKVRWVSLLLPTTLLMDTEDDMMSSGPGPATKRRRRVVKEEI